MTSEDMFHISRGRRSYDQENTNARIAEALRVVHRDFHKRFGPLRLFYPATPAALFSLSANHIKRSVAKSAPASCLLSRDKSCIVHPNLTIGKASAMEPVTYVGDE